ncbi:hypothetical protein [Treponema primitia]|uniref:hypothetical protein n=1 Tax=Treponema primitia TaxID=88058 RepID=UPI0002F23E79|nr:hypothetical protein [Treponema primitia]
MKITLDKLMGNTVPGLPPVGLPGYKKPELFGQSAPRGKHALFPLLAVTIALALTACGDPDGGPTNLPIGGTTPTVSTVTVSPADPSIAKGATQAFTAVVDGTNDPAQTVTWSVAGNARIATAFNGATLTVANDEIVTSLTVRATSTLDPTKFGTTTVTLVPFGTPTVTLVTVDPADPSIAKGGTQAFTAVVTGSNDPTQTVTWSVTGRTNPATTFVGTTLIVATDETATSLTVRATSTFDPTKSGITTVTVVAAGTPTVSSVTVSPASPNIAKGGTQAFTATVSGLNSPAQTVTWSVTGGVTGTGFSGTTLTVASNETATSLTVRATSTVDPTKSGTATVTVTGATPPPTPPSSTVHFVAAGYWFRSSLPYGPYGFATSSDGKTWTLQTSSFGSSYIRDVAHGKDGNGNGLWVAVGGGSFSDYGNGNGGKIATSSDGVTWTQQSHSFGSTNVDGINGVAYGKDSIGNGLWIAVGNNGKIATSNDGINWAVRATSFGSTDVNSVAYGKYATGNNVWVAVGDDGKIATSDNGTNWYPLKTDSFDTASIYDVAYGKDENGDGLWVAVGNSKWSSLITFSDFSRLATSKDVETWTQQKPDSFSGGLNERINSVAYGKDADGSGLWVAVGSSGELAVSKDGVKWDSKTSGFDIDTNSTTNTIANGIDSVAYGVDDNGNSLWVAVGGIDKPQLSTSKDGETWNRQTSLNNIGFTIAYINAVATDFEPLP